MLSTDKKSMNIFKWIAVGLTSFVILAVVGYMVYTNGHPLGKF
jgi:uncharacterized membrane protein YukC